MVMDWRWGKGKRKSSRMTKGLYHGADGGVSSGRGNGFSGKEITIFGMLGTLRYQSETVRLAGVRTEEKSWESSCV